MKTKAEGGGKGVRGAPPKVAFVLFRSVPPAFMILL